jgi:type I restriction enzyme, S subunit
MPIFDDSIKEDFEHLPDGWIEKPLSQLIELLESGARPKGGVRGIVEGVPSIGGEHLAENGGFRFDSIKYVPFRFFERMNRGRIQIGDILVVKDGATTGKVALVREDFPYNPAVVNEHVFICRPNKTVHPEFLFYFLFCKEGQDRILSNFRGSAQGGINQSFAGRTSVPVAPLDEQKRIVAKIEELLPKVNAVRERLTRVKEIMKRFRQSVLSSAVPKELLNESEDTNGSNDGLKVAELSEVAESIQIGPFGSLLHRSDYISGGIPVINPTNIKDGKIEPSPEVSISISKSSELNRYTLQEGDVIVGRRGEMGRCAVVSRNEADWICGTGSLFIRPGVNLISEYLELQISSPRGIAYLEEASVGSTMTNLNQRVFREMKISTPPVDEQSKVVHRVKKLLEIAGNIEKRVEIELSRIDKMNQAILAKAFRGELVTK